MAYQMTARPNSGRKVAKASLLDTALILKDVVVPTLAKGPLIRRRKVVGMAERAHLDDRAVKRMQGLRRKYGNGPLLLAIPFRPQAVLLSAEDVREVLEQSPEPFAAATREKQSALGHFEPENVLASRGRHREIRRDLNEKTLETGCERHSMAGHFAKVVAEEMDLVCAEAMRRGVLDWDGFFTGWMRMVRRIVLGDAARDDAELTDLLERLRYRANYAFLRPKAPGQRQQLLDQLEHYAIEAAPHSLVGEMARHCTDAEQMPHHQLPQYLFAFDPGAMATYRALAMLLLHDDALKRVLAEMREASGEQAPRLPFLRACLLEALCLWPTTPAILRETTSSASWSESRLDENTHLLIFTPFFHRDDETVPNAHRFDPDRWIERIARPEDGFVPFSHGPVQCPAAHFVPMIASLAMRHILTRTKLQVAEPERFPLLRLPGTFDNFSLKFAVPKDGEKR
jgi:hypothetical protein